MAEPAKGMEGVEAAVANMATTVDGMRWFSMGLGSLASVLERTGAEIKGLFENVSLQDLDEDTRAIAEIFVAWREVGEAQVTLAARMTDLVASLRGRAESWEAEREQRETEAARLQEALRAAEGGGSGWIGWLFKGAPTPEEAAAERQKLDKHRETTESCLLQIATQVGATDKSYRAAVADAVGEARRHAKVVGEKMSLLKPSWRGGTGGKPAKALSAAQLGGGGGAAAGGGTGHIDGLIKTLSTAEGRQKHQEAERKKDEKLLRHSPSKASAEAAPMMAPPVEQLGESAWRIKGVYDHQVLKAGLRRLDAQWVSGTTGLLEMPRGKDGGILLFRESLFRDLLSGKILLQSVTGNDISAAQSDIKRLSLLQLLHLRVRHIDFTPSGCGADTVHAVGRTHEAFLATLDGLLFQELGRKAAAGAGQAAAAAAEPLKPDEAHRLGREAVLLYAAAAAVPAPSWWVWWMTDEHRVFFDAAGFASSASFGDCGGGVLEITDLSKADRNDPSGKLKWLDWRVDLITGEGALASAPKRGNLEPKQTAGASFCNPSADNSPSSPQKAESAASVGGATATMVSPDVLKNMRGTLRKTGTPSSAAPSSPATSPSKPSWAKG